MTDFKLFGKTKHIKEVIKIFAKSVDGFAKYDDGWKIVLTTSKTTKGRSKKIHEFAKNNNLKCYEQKYDGSKYARIDINYSSFSKAIHS